MINYSIKYFISKEITYIPVLYFSMREQPLFPERIVFWLTLQGGLGCCTAPMDDIPIHRWNIAHSSRYLANSRNIIPGHIRPHGIPNDPAGHRHRHGQHSRTRIWQISEKKKHRQIKLMYILYTLWNYHISFELAKI